MTESRAYLSEDVSKEKEKVYFDNTRMSAFRKCPRMFYLRHVKHLVPKKISMAPEYGIRIHDVLKDYYADPSLDITELTLHYFADWEDNPFDEKRTKSNAVTIMRGYVKNYPKEPWEVIANELPFELPLGETASYQFYLIGRIDLIVQMHGALYGMDHKTTTRLGDTYFNAFKPNQQIEGYLWGSKQMFGVDNVQGFFINAILVAKTKTNYKRHLTTRTKAQIQEFEHHTLTWMQYIQDRIDLYQRYSHMRDVAFPMATEACSYFGGCPYKDACLAQLNPHVLETQYVEDPWDPRKEMILEEESE